MSPKRRSPFSSEGGFSAAWRAWFRAEVPVPRLLVGGEHLDLVRRDPHPFRQAPAAQVHDGLRRALRVPAGEEKEVVIVLPQVGHLPRVHQVCVADDGALGRLPEDLGEPHGGHSPAADQVPEQIPRPHGGQLVRVSHQHQPAVIAQAGQQRRHQRHIHHGGLVHDDGVRLQRVVLPVAEDQTPTVGVKAGLQQAVDGGCLRTAQLPPAAWPPGQWGPPGRSPAPGSRTGPALHAGRWSCRCPAPR